MTPTMSLEEAKTLLANNLLEAADLDALVAAELERCATLIQEEREKEYRFRATCNEVADFESARSHDLCGAVLFNLEQAIRLLRLRQGEYRWGRNLTRRLHR